VNPAVNPNYAAALLGVRTPQVYDVPMFAGDPALRETASATAANFSGGNHVVEVTVGNASGTQTLHLMGGAMPGGFTLVGVPTVHAVVARQDTVHCSPLGCWAWHDTTGLVYGHVSVSYDGGNTWKVWCNQLGIYTMEVGQGGAFIGSDPRANFNPDDPQEKAGSLIKRCADTGAPMPGPTPTPEPPPRWPRAPITPVPATPRPDVSAPSDLPPDYCQANPNASLCAPAATAAPG
jgi:hypothetical protein